MQQHYIKLYGERPIPPEISRNAVIGSGLDLLTANTSKNWQDTGGVAKAPPRDFQEKKMLTLEHSAHEYDEATDGCRRLVRVTQDNVRQWQRVIDADQATKEAEEREACCESKSARKQ